MWVNPASAIRRRSASVLAQFRDFPVVGLHQNPLNAGRAAGVDELVQDRTFHAFDVELQDFDRAFNFRDEGGQIDDLDFHARSGIDVRFESEER